MRVFQLFAAVFSQAVVETVESVTIYYGGAFAFLVFVLTVVLSVARKGPSGMKMDLATLMNGVPAVVLAALLVLAWHTARIPYQAYERQRQAAETARSEKAELEARLNTRRHYMDINEPAFRNAWAVRMAFVQWDKALGTEPRTFLVTADRDAGPLPGAVIQYAVPAAGTGNGSLLNIGIKPEDAERLADAASVPETLIFHAGSDVKGALQLYDALAPLVVRIERRYQMPETSKPLPPHTIWLHFGKGVRWSSEYWEEEAAKSTRP